jgi:hypothetical protein
VLRVPAEIAQTLVDQKETRSYTDKKRDIHEADLEHLRKSVEVYDDLCNLFPKDFTRIDCVRGNRLLGMEEVHALLWEKIVPRLPVKHPKAAASTVKQSYSADTIYMPGSFDADTRAAYGQTVATLMEKRSQLLQNTDLDAETRGGLEQALLPVAAYVGEYLDAQKTVEQHLNHRLADLAAQALPHNHAQTDDSQFALVDYWPRNELNALPATLFPYVDFPLKALQNTTDTWQYAAKADALEMYYSDSGVRGLANVGYMFDLVTNIETLFALDKVAGPTVYHQELTPRYGYDDLDLPGELNEVVDECFDLSMQLYSQLQAAGKEREAQYATLLGHKVRLLIVLQDRDVNLLRSTTFTPKVRTVVDKIMAAIATVHPVLSESSTTGATKSPA